jgi:hypothetical protein
MSLGGESWWCHLFMDVIHVSRLIRDVATAHGFVRHKPRYHSDQANTTQYLAS